MRIAIFGVGGVGGYFGARLAQAGEDVVFLARGEHLRAIVEHGLGVESAGESVVVRPALATDDPAEVGTVDVVILAVKTWQLGEALQAIEPMIGPETFVLPLQNGVEACEEIAAASSGFQVVGGLCATVSYVNGPGSIFHVAGPTFLKFGELDGRSSRRTDRLREAFQRAGVKAEIPADIRAAIWEKFLFVVSLGGVGAVTRAPVGILCGMEETRGLLRECMEEIFRIGRARGIGLRDGLVEKTLGFMESLPPEGTTSLQRDMIAGKPSELEAWNGAVVRLGAECGVATPAHSFLYRSLLPLESRARGRVEFA